MPNDTIWIGVISLGILVLAMLMAGRFSVNPGWIRRYRHTALLGIRVRGGAGHSERSRHRRTRSETENSPR